MKLSDSMKPWKVSDFEEVNKPCGPYRRVIGQIDVDFIDSIIYLSKEDGDNGRLFIAMYDKDNGKLLANAGFYLVDESIENQQKALDAMYTEVKKVADKYDNMYASILH